MVGNAARREWNDVRRKTPNGARQRGVTLTTLVEALGALSGLVLLVYFIGGLVFALRLKALGVPVFSTVGVLPTGWLVVTAVHGLGAAVVGAAIGASVVAFVLGVGSRVRQWLSRVLLFLILVIGGAWAWWREGPGALWLLGIALVVVAGMAFFWLRLKVEPRPLALFVQLFAGLLISLALISGIVAAVPPTVMDFVSVRLKSGGTTDGYYLAADADTLYVVPNVSHWSVGVVSAIPRDEVQGFRLIHEHDDISPIGGTIAPSIVGSLSQIPRSGNPYISAPKVAASIRRGSEWVYPPTTPLRAIDNFADSYWYFSAQHPQLVLPQNQRVRLGSVLRAPQYYIGRSFVTRGVVVVAHPVQTPTAERESHPVQTPTAERESQRWFIVFRPMAPSESRAACAVALPLEATSDELAPPSRVSVDDVIDVRVSVLAYGKAELAPGEATNMSIFLCGGLGMRSSRPSSS